MRRPLFAIALCLVILAAVRLKTGMADHVRPGCISTGELRAADTLTVTGQIYQKDEQSIYLKSITLRESSQKFLLQEVLSQEDIIINENVSQEGIIISENLICETERASELPLGSFVTLRGVFSPFSQATNPGEFDSAVYYRTLRIGGRLRKTEILFQGEAYWHVGEALYCLKTCLKERLDQIFPEKEAAVMCALLLGDKSALDRDLKNLYQRNGILHILSISSLHITIFGMGIYQLLRRLGMPITPAAVTGSVVVLLYGGMTGFGVSVCRAIGMYLIRMLGEAVGRTYDMLTALGVIGALMVTVNSYYLQNGGFLLSFTSVLGMGVVFPALMPEFSKRRKKVMEPLFVSLSIMLSTLPVQLWLYYEVPVWSVFLNLLVIPLVKPLMISGFLALVPGLGILGRIDGLILGGYEFLCGCFDQLPFHSWNPGCPKIGKLIVYYLILLGVVAVRTYGRQHLERRENRGLDKRISGLCAVFLCVAVLSMGISGKKENSVTFLDVGQGDCILVRLASGQTYLFDCGSSSRSNVGKYVLIPYLKYSGIHTIDAVFVSHPDADHVNGVLELFALCKESNLVVRQVLLPDIEEGAREEQFGEISQAISEAGWDNRIPVSYLSVGDHWECGSAFFACMHPGREYCAENANAYSECFYVEFKESMSGRTGEEWKWTLLLTGDVEGRGEEDLLEELMARSIREVTVLKAAHHGSRNSSSKAFLDQVCPKLTVISCGRNNRYGHPHEELLERLKETETLLLQTSQSGAITVAFRKGRLVVSIML